MTRARGKGKFNVSSNSLTPVISQLTPQKRATAPVVWYDPKAWEKIRHLIAVCEKEVGWLGYVEMLGDDYYITEIFVPAQRVHGAETDISPSAMADLALELMDRDMDPGKLFYWGHSHVNMGVGPSGQDESQIEEFLESCPLFIRGIYNKKGASKVDIYDVPNNTIYQTVENEPISILTQAEIDELDAIIKKNVTEAYTYTGGYNYGNNGYNHQGYNHNQTQKNQGLRTVGVQNHGSNFGQSSSGFTETPLARHIRAFHSDTGRCDCTEHVLVDDNRAAVDDIYDDESGFLYRQM